MNNRENFVYRIMQLQKQNNLNDHELSRLLGYKANNMNILYLYQEWKNSLNYAISLIFRLKNFSVTTMKIQNGLIRLLKGCKISMKKNAK